jgi:hypothetical protein
MPKSPEKEPVVSPNKHSASIATLPADDIESIDGAALNGDDTIDDTCFSAFSEIPNMEMTRFARMGSQSPSKRSVIADQVYLLYLRPRKCDTNIPLRRRDLNQLSTYRLRRPLHEPEAQSNTTKIQPIYF